MAAKAAVKKEMKVKGFVPSANGFQFPNRFPGLPLPPVIAKMIDTSKSVHGLCGGMCFTVVDFATANRKPPKVDDVPDENTPLYHYLAQRQLASWGRMEQQVLRYIQWMAFSDKRAARESDKSVKDLRARLDAGHLTVLGLIYHDFQETLAVWDNHQVLAYGYSVLADKRIHIHLYDPNYPKRDDVYLEVTSTPVWQWWKRRPGVSVEQFRGDEKVFHLHGFFIVPYEPETPPGDIV
jgi:hypothetical protein